ncbi:MAG: hypothetical protein COA41_09650 [Sphingopyxis sp.]|nr:MAG: hypothetical protein COA41_09650 [Sphingopyxis sp.]
MAGPRIFTSFAIEDISLRDLFIGQSRNSRTNFELTDYAVKKPWENSWKTQCRTRIKSCRGVVGIVTPNSRAADGQLWELKCAYEELVPTMLIYGNEAAKTVTYPAPISGRRINLWNWTNIEKFIEGL